MIEEQRDKFIYIVVLKKAEIVHPLHESTDQGFHTLSAVVDENVFQAGGQYLSGIAVLIHNIMYESVTGEEAL